MKNNIPMLVGIGLPVLFVVALFAFVALPGMFGAKPSVDFVFAIRNDEYYQGPAACTYRIDDEGKIVRESQLRDSYSMQEKLPGRNFVECTDSNYPTLYKYAPNSDVLREISFSEAQELSLDKGPSSPDGFTARMSDPNYDIFDVLGSSNSQPMVEIVKDGRTRESFDIPSDGSYYYSDRFDFVGWVVAK